MRYELSGGPLDGKQGEVDDDYAGNLSFPYSVPTDEDHDPTDDRRSELRYRKTEGVTHHGGHIFVYDSVLHRQR